jgi:CRP-like cAMP-binding protein
MNVVAGSPHQALVRKLSRFLRLSRRDVAALADLTKRVRRLPARTEIVAEGDVPHPAFVLVEGMACRFRILSDGRRQIIGFIIPGDICDVHAAMLKRMDHSIGTIVASSIATIARDRFLALTTQHPRINAALWWTALQDQATQREHVVALGRRNAHERVAYFLCELVWRFNAHGLGRRDAIELPMTQADIGDLLGLTPVHVNRVLQDFRKQKLIMLEHRHLRLLDMERVAGIAELSSQYLLLDGAPAAIELECDRQERLTGLLPPRGAA